MGNWFINVRFRVPIRSEIIGALIHPFQPRFLKRWYYRKSFDWWGHPSNHHWKYSEIRYCSFHPIFGRMLKLNTLVPGERDLWAGSYIPLPSRPEDKIKKIRIEKIDSILRNSL